MHATLIELASVSSCWYLATGVGDLVKLDCDGDRPLQLLVFDISASHQLALITFLPLAFYTLLITTTDLMACSDKIFELED